LIWRQRGLAKLQNPDVIRFASSFFSFFPSIFIYHAPHLREEDCLSFAKPRTHKAGWRAKEDGFGRKLPDFVLIQRKR